MTDTKQPTGITQSPRNQDHYVRATETSNKIQQRKVADIESARQRLTESGMLREAPRYE